MDNDYVVALYLRISDEDEDTSHGYSESNSIIGQRIILNSFVESQPEFANSQILEFSDDGYSGTNFNRPGITSLLALAKSKSINCIIVKDFSRFGRNYLEVGNYLEQIFPFLGIRFISVNDSFDSCKNYGAAGAIDVTFKNLIHDLYSKDISEKVRCVRKAKAESGKFVTAFAPYGYMKSKSNKNILVIDEECARIVRRIYGMALQDVSKAEIARTLNAENIPSPMMIRKMRKDNFKSWCANEKCHWTTSTIAHILDDQRYVGDLIYGKLKPTAVGSRKDIRAPKEDWIIVPNAHVAIITREAFNSVNERKKTHNYKRLLKPLPFSGKILCAVCNRSMIRKANRSNDSAVFFCKTHWNTDTYKCFEKNISEAEIETAVLSALNTLVGLCDKADSSPKPDKREMKNEIILKDIVMLERSLLQLKSIRLEHYECYRAGQMKKEIFLEKKKQYEEKIEAILKEKNRLECESLKLQQHTLLQGNIFKDLKGYAPFEVLTQEIADKFLDTVLVEGNGRIKIKWAFSNPF